MTAARRSMERRASIGRLRRKLAATLAVLFAAFLANPASGVEADLSRPGAGGAPTPVRVFLYLADLQEVSGAEQSFLADLVMIAEWEDSRLAGRWTGPRSVGLDEIWNPRLQVVNQRGVTAFLPQKLRVEPSGRVRYQQRWWGRFSARMDLRDFPRDRQDFHVQVISLGYPRSEVDLAPHVEDNHSGRSQQLSVTDWTVGPARMGLADYQSSPGVEPLAGVQLTWEGRRYMGYYTVQVILPLVMIVLMGWTALWVEASVVNTRISVSITTMLTLIAYRFALGRLVPNLSYLTRFDYFMLGSTILVFLMLLVVAAGAYLYGRDRKAVVHRINRWARALFPLAFTLMLLVIWGT